jgi:predicted DNA-binding protein with PD1-like motif
MKVFAQGNALLLRLTPEEDLVEALESYSGQGALWVDGSGSLRDVELEDADGEVRKVGSVEALSIRGVATADEVELHGTFMRGAQALGGRLRRAKVVRCVLRGERFQAVDAADSFSPESLGGGSERGSWAAAAAASTASARVAASPAPAAPSTSGGWGAAIAASEAAQQVRSRKARPRAMAAAPQPQTIRSAKTRAKMPAFLDEPEIEPGDFVDHKQFGICKVVQVSDDAALLIKLPTGRTKQIKLTVLEVLPAREDTNRRIFPLRPRSK